ncbi:MAG: ABC transporter substrate-binding protein [Gaiellaceae bacterium]
MRSRRTLLSLAAFLLGLTLLATAACGGSDDEGGGGTTTTTETKRGGTARFNLKSDTDYTDPALAYYQVSWQQEYATCLKLLNYPDAPAPKGSQLTPEAAASLPKVSDDGKTYTFTVRSGFKFSPPSNQEVTAETFKFVIERVLNAKMQSPGASFITDIAGAQEFLDGKAKSVSGLSVSGDQLTIKLTKVAPDLVSRIAMPFFCAIPTDTPIDPKGVEEPSMAGPYYIKKRIAKRTLVLERNPNYAGDRVANLDRIVYTVGVNENAGLLQIKQGDADYAADAIPPTAHCELDQLYGKDSQAAKDGKQQYFVHPALIFSYLGLNTQREAFKDPKVRQAVSYAIDRPGISKQSGCFAGTLTDQHLPPGVQGFEDADIYPLDGPDLEKAKQLMGGKKVKAVMYTCNAGSCPKRAQIVQQNLQAIGIDVEIRQFERAVQFEKEGIKGEPVDIADEGWIADYPDPYDFLNKLLSGDSIQAKNNTNFSYFDVDAVDAKLEEAARLSGDERFTRYAELDAEIARDYAPLANYQNDNNRDFFSARIGCQVYQPIYGMDINTLCVRE